MRIYSNGKMIEVGGCCGDVYSTEEQRIGTWIDGKPLYRNVIHFSSPPLGNNDNYAIAELSELECDTFVLGWWTGKVAASGVVYSNGFINVSGTSLMIQNRFTDSSFAFVGFASIYYTKTTDQATIETQSLLASKSDNVLSANSIPIQTMATTASAEIKNEEG